MSVTTLKGTQSTNPHQWPGLILSSFTTGLLAEMVLRVVVPFMLASYGSVRKTVHPFHGRFYRTTWVSCHQKGPTNLDFNEARDDGVAVPSAGSYANYLYLAADR